MNPLLKVILACCLDVFLSFLFLGFFLSFFCRLWIFFTTFLLYFIRLLCVFTFLSLLRFVCRFSLFPISKRISSFAPSCLLLSLCLAYCRFLSVLHSSFLYFHFLFCFVSYVGCPYFLFPGVFLFCVLYSFIFGCVPAYCLSFLIIYSPLSSFMWRFVWYTNCPRHKNTCPQLLHMLWRSFTCLVLVLVLATKPLHALVSSVDVQTQIRENSGGEVL